MSETSSHTCTSCARDVEDCSCTDCMCAGCLTSSCHCKSTKEADLDSMVERASVPNLAALFKAGKESGLISPTPAYGN